MKARGFTLLELLVAITVLSIVSIISWRGLDSLVATRERLEPEVDEVRAMLIAFGQMERDLTQVVNPAFLGLSTSPVNVRPADGVWMLELARVAPPAPDRPTEVQTVYYRIIDNTLIRQSTPALPGFDRARTDQLENARLLQRVQSMDFRLWQPGVGWTPPGDRVDVGTAPGAPGAPPVAPGARALTAPGLEVTVTRSDGRTYRRIFLVNA
jgi:general secretion pathway protein J